MDCGLLSICPGGNKVFYDTPMESIYDFSTYSAEHVFSTQDASKHWVRNLTVGLRVTFLFGFQPQEHCILCDPANH